MIDNVTKVKAEDYESVGAGLSHIFAPFCSMAIVSTRFDLGRPLCFNFANYARFWGVFCMIFVRIWSHLPFNIHISSTLTPYRLPLTFGFELRPIVLTSIVLILPIDTQTSNKSCFYT